MNVRRQRHVPDALDRSDEVLRRLEAQRALPELVGRENSRRQAGTMTRCRIVKQQCLAFLNLLRRPHKNTPAVVTLRVREMLRQENLDEPARSRRVALRSKARSC